MTRKEWVNSHYPNSIDKRFIAGVLGCPYKYRELCELDPAVRETMICPGIHTQPNLDEPMNCITCWNTPLPEEEGKAPSNKVEIRKTMVEPHIGDIFYTIVSITLGNYRLYVVGEFTVNSMSAVNDRQVRCTAFDDQLEHQYTFFYNLVNKTICFNYEVQHQAKNTPNLDRSLFLERSDAVNALEKWTGNVFDRRSYVLIQKGEQK